MDEIRLLVVGDIHLSDQHPGSRSETYGEDIFAKCAAVFALVEQHDATHVLLLGDVFDSKVASKISHRLVQRLSKMLLSLKVPVYILVGNHDVSLGTLETIERQPIGTLGLLSGVELLTWDKVQLAPDVALYPVPGVPLGADWKKHFVTGGDETRRIVVAHQLIAPDVNSFHAEARHNFYDANEVARTTDANMVLWGDLHSNCGTYKLNNRDGDPVVMSNRGSLCRLSIGDVKHKPEVILFTFSGTKERSVGAKVIPVPFRPAEEVFLIEEKAAEKEHQKDIDETIRQMKTTRIHKFSIDSVIEDMKSNTTIPETVKSTAVDLVEAIR